VRVLAEAGGGKWLRVRAADGTDGWISSRYLQRDAPPRTAADPEQPTDGVGTAGPGMAGTCPFPSAFASAKLGVTTPAVVPEVGPVSAASGTPTRIIVASYNVWELYDGQGGDQYLARDHADALDAPGVTRRVAALGAQLRPAQPHVIAFQEIENAALACRVAEQAVPRARWRCAAGRWASGSSPQNVALATRLPGQLRVLDPQGRFATRGAVELVALGGRLRILSVHLKSSRGARGMADCRNAVRRQAMATALVGHLRGDPRSAALVVGDFNFDPRQARHDQTDETLEAGGLKNLVAQFHPQGALSTYPRFRSTIDLAFFRAAPGVRAEGFAVLSTAKSDRWTSDHLPVTVSLGITAP
jgi:endonuclease/exonuclease/phosphatase family metal-dependent hydrolase